METKAEQLPLFTLAADPPAAPAIPCRAGRPAPRGRQERTGALQSPSKERGTQRHRRRRHAAPQRQREQPPSATAGHHLRQRAFEVFAETLFPTRCPLCDAPGTVLCDRCARRLPYIDATLACPRCGAPYGRVQCTECNPVLMAPFGCKEPPWDGAVSALVLTEAARRVVTVYKDQGERGLARPMAAIMGRYLPPAWLADEPAVAFVPATPGARRRRGFDHAELLARELSWIIGAEWAPLLAAPRRLDQRRLSRTARIQNMRASMRALPGATIPPAIILVDDVCTTGSTLMAAVEALREGGAHTVYCATFART